MTGVTSNFYSSKIPRITSQLQLPQDFIPKKVFTYLSHPLEEKWVKNIAFPMVKSQAMKRRTPYCAVFVTSA